MSAFEATSSSPSASASASASAVTVENDEGELMREVTLALTRSFAPSGNESAGEDAAEQMRNERHLERLYAACKARYGLAHVTTASLFFQLFDVWIGLYRLDKCHEALAELMPAIAANPELHSRYDFRLTQSLAFTRWKQGAFREALSLFEKMEKKMESDGSPPSPALMENMAHTYSTMGMHEQAKTYFEKCLTMNGENRGGVLLGLGILKGRMSDKVGEGLDECLQALAWYEERFSKKGNTSSLEAKCCLSITKMYLDLGDFKNALHYADHAVGIFRVTSGEESPLVASALKSKGDALWKLGKEPEHRLQAREAYTEAFKLAADKDAIDLMELIEINRLLTDTIQAPFPQTPSVAAPALDRSLFAPIFAIARRASDNAQRRLPHDGNLGAFLKIMAEVGVYANDLAGARTMLVDAIACFEKDKSGMDLSGLITQCRELVLLIESALSK